MKGKTLRGAWLVGPVESGRLDLCRFPVRPTQLPNLVRCEPGWENSLPVALGPHPKGPAPQAGSKAAAGACGHHSGPQNCLSSPHLSPGTSPREDRVPSEGRAGGWGRWREGGRETMWARP